MAARVLRRRALREQNDQVEQAAQSDREQDGADEPVEGDDEPASEEKVKKPRARKAVVKPPKVKAPPKPRTRKAAKAPPRLFAQWAVCDNGLKRVAVFEYRDRIGADSKLAEMLERKPGAYVLQLIKVSLDPTPAAAVQPVPAV